MTYILRLERPVTDSWIDFNVDIPPMFRDYPKAVWSFVEGFVRMSMPGWEIVNYREALPHELEGGQDV